MEVGNFVKINKPGDERDGMIVKISETIRTGWAGHANSYKLKIPVFNIGLGAYSVNDIEISTMQAFKNQFGITNPEPVRSDFVGESFNNEPLHTQLAMVIYNISKAPSIQQAETIMQRYLHLFRR